MNLKKIELILTICIYSASGAAVITLLLEYGFSAPPLNPSMLHLADYVIAGVFVANTFFRLLIAPVKTRYLKAHIVEFILAVMLLFTLLLIRELVPAIHPKNIIAVTKIYLIAIQVYMAVYIVFHLSFVGKKASELGLKPPQIVLLSFLAVVLIGTLLLSLPNATASGERAPFLTALFTATSATTVTGLVVVDTGSYFSTMGQITILSLIQIGGLGMMTLVAFFALIAGRGMGLKESAVVGDMLDQVFMGRVKNLVVAIILTTLALELIGTGLLYIIWKGDPYFQGRTLYFSLFHAISAFCNAGFSLFQDSFIRFRNNYPFNLVIIALIILGGLGFQVLTNLMNVITKRQAKNRARAERLSLHTKLVLTASGILVVLGTLFFLGLMGGEVGGEKLPVAERVMAALFQSVTTRTAGFNTVNIGLMSTPFIFLALLFMFIGASPGSTGGGIKTSTAAVTFAFMFSIFSGKDKVTAFKRTIPDEFIKKTLAVIMGSFGLIAVITLLLTLFEKYSFKDLLFEATSAVGTVGLSRGITPHLSMEGKILIIAAMFLGRTGPLTLFLALSYRRRKAAFEYPEERVLIG
jgi:trk system potassium uptake protein TrkH